MLRIDACALTTTPINGVQNGRVTGTGVENTRNRKGLGEQGRSGHVLHQLPVPVKPELSVVLETGILFPLTPAVSRWEAQLGDKGIEGNTATPVCPLSLNNRVVDCNEQRVKGLDAVIICRFGLISRVRGLKVEIGFDLGGDVEPVQGLAQNGVLAVVAVANHGLVQERVVVVIVVVVFLEGIQHRQ